ncbi:MAG: Ppx/GppA family phosphatase [Deltaproteobacteria bacterium]|nr:Ppx/GppA family phosphatase [Deltaproteobacteria bacterium]
MKTAVVDIGTNSVLLTIADVEGRDIKNVTELSRITRLGKGFGDDGIIREENIEITINALKEFSDKIHNKGVEKVKYVATEVLRSAKNSDYVLKKLSGVCLGNIEIIDGSKEGFYSFYSVSFLNPSKEICVVDVGGGSTEITTGVDSDIRFTKSIKIGAVGIFEKFFSGSDIYKRDAILNASGYINEMLEKDIPSGITGNFTTVYVSGGTITNIGAILEGMNEYKPELIENRAISFQELQGLFETISQMKRQERAKIAGIEPERADILPAGVLIIRNIINYLGRDSIRVSTKGVRWGIIFRMNEEGE